MTSSSVMGSTNLNATPGYPLEQRPDYSRPGNGKTTHDTFTAASAIHIHQTAIVRHALVVESQSQGAASSSGHNRLLVFIALLPTVLHLQDRNLRRTRLRRTPFKMSTLGSSAQLSATSPRVPVLGEGFQETPKVAISKSAEDDDIDHDAAKSGKRRLFGFGKKKEDDKTKLKKNGEKVPTLVASHPSTTIAQPSPQRVPDFNASPPRSNPNTSSPQRHIHSSSSPRLASPAGSQIFERDVQESALNSPAIPSHIQTEDHIPPVLDASSEAITNRELDPDTVEIVMHSSHQPAAVTVTGIAEPPHAGHWADELVAHPDKDDAASNYGALDSTDVRRLSFISFSDIVQSEHAEHAGSRESVYVAGLSSLSSGHNRSPSPIRSPVSSQGIGTSPPTSHPASVKGLDMSPRGKPLGSPISTHAPQLSGGELTIETLSQALGRTGSGDLSGFRSQPLSPISQDGVSDRPFQ